MKTGDGYTAPRRAVTQFECLLCTLEIKPGDLIRYDTEPGPGQGHKGAWVCASHVGEDE